MKSSLLLVCAGVLALGLAGPDAHAKRLGDHSPKGMQREPVTRKQAPAQPSTAQQPAPAAQAAPAVQGNWMGPLTGLAAGIGLASLLSPFGLGEGIANIVMALLLVAAAIVLLSLLLRRRPVDRGPVSEPMHYAGVGGPSMFPAPESVFKPPTPGHGNEAPTPSAPQRSIPSDFDQEAFLRMARTSFVRLQTACDAGNVDDIRQFTTPEMFAEISRVLIDRSGSLQSTEVVALHAELLDLVNDPVRSVASVRFQGMIREEPDAAAQPFDEIWSLVKPVDGCAGWALSSVQQLT